MTTITTTGASAVAAARGTLSREHLAHLIDRTPDGLAIATRFVPATDTKGSRISASCIDRDGKRRRVSMPYRHELGGCQNHLSAALQLASKVLGVNCSRAILAIVDVPGGWQFVVQI